VYGLKDGELVRRVAPPYPGCRAEYFKDLWREIFKQNRDYTIDAAKFEWKNGWCAPGLTYQMYTSNGTDAGISLWELLDTSLRFNRARIDAGPGVLETKVTGDWVLRADTDPAKLVAPLGAILRKECGLKLTVELKDVEQEVYVLSGKYESKPVPYRKEHHIEIFTRELTDLSSGWGGSGTFSEMSRCLEDWVEVPVVLGPIEGLPKQISWHASYRGKATEAQRAEDRNPTAVMTNVAAQAGLKVGLEKRTIKMLVVRRAP
jgi:hypothetical protein